MGLFVSRQIYYYGGNSVVEVEINGLDNAGPDMLEESYKELGEGKEYNDPREAIKAAIAVRDAWRKADPTRNPEDTIEIAVGTTGGMGMEIEATSQTDEELLVWAEERWIALPKCDHCGELRDEKDTYRVIDDPDFGDFCSESCCETAHDLVQQRTCQECYDEVPEGRKYFCSDECEEKHEEA